MVLPAGDLSVFFNDEIVGLIRDTDPMSFEYAGTWMDTPIPMAIGAIPWRRGPIDDVSVQAYFENLLPEGELRDYVSEQRKATTLYSLLREVAGDTAGGFVIVPAGKSPRDATYEATSWTKLASKLNEGSASAIDVHGKNARISLAGAQQKASIAIFADGVPQLAQGTAPSTHILKPDIKRLPKVWHSAANEAIIMRAALHCGLPTAKVFYEPETQSCVVERFDRVHAADGSIQRLIQYDMCQLAGTLSLRKYEKEGGPGLATCASLIRRYSSRTSVDIHHLVAWVFFNLYVGNNDSHAKNLSIYSTPEKGVSLTPFYDLMCTRLYPGLSTEFAFSVGGKVSPGQMTRDDIVLMAKGIGVSPAYALRTAQEMAAKIPGALVKAVDEISPVLSSGAKTLADKLTTFVFSNTKKSVARFLS